MANHNTNQFIEEVRTCFQADRRLERLSADARAEVESDILATVFLRKASRGRAFNHNYVYALVKYQLRPKPTRDPYIRKARCRAEERQRWGLRVGPFSLSMTTRSPESEPIDDLLRQEEVDTEGRQFRQIESELQKLKPRAKSVMAKYLRGENLSQEERCVWYRSVQTLKARLRLHST